MNKRFFSFDPTGDEMTFHETGAQAKDTAQEVIDFKRLEEEFTTIDDDICWGALFEEEVDCKLVKTPKAKEFDSLIEVVQLTYRKHHLNDADIGWEELAAKLLDTLCNIMGEVEFLNWVTSLNSIEAELSAQYHKV